MSRIGKQSVEVPKGVEVKISGGTVSVKGPKGSASHQLPAGFTAVVKDSALAIAPAEITDQTKPMWGLHRVLVANMVKGVTDGYQKTLDITGVGYKAEAVGKNIKLTVGYSHSVTIQGRTGINFKLESPTRILVDGIDKQLVGQIAAEIRAVRPPEPYKGKGIRYTTEHVRRKAGKAAVK